MQRDELKMDNFIISLIAFILSFALAIAAVAAKIREG